MKRNDFFFIVFVILLFLPFFISSSVFEFYETTNKEHGLLMSMLKFGILATLGEIIGLRIRSGSYFQKNFGILPRAVVWAVLGWTIALSFKVFASGTPIFVEYLGLQGAISSMKGEICTTKIVTAFAISATMNLIFAPVMMTLHKITDTHITQNGGTLAGFFRPIKFGEIMTNMNWAVQWNFVFKKTIPFFWIPAHTITFLMPEEYRVLFAALLGIMLGVLLAVAKK